MERKRKIKDEHMVNFKTCKQSCGYGYETESRSEKGTGGEAAAADASRTEKRHSPQATPFPENITNTVL